MNVTENWTLPGHDSQTIYGSTDLPPAGGAPSGVMLLCHGFKGYKDYGFFPWLGRQAAARGIVSVRFNFSHSGVTDDPRTFARVDLFQRDTWSRQIHDLLAVAAAVHDAAIPGVSKSGLPAVWFGHSRGGATALMAAARCFEQSLPHSPCGVVAAASPSCPCQFSEQQQQQLRQQGYLESPSSRTGQMLRVGVDWLNDIQQQGEAVDPAAAIGKIECPVLIIHGDADETVALDAAHTLHKAAPGQSKVHVIKGGTHTFNAANPMAEKLVPQTIELAEQTMSLARQCLSEQRH